MKLVLKNFFLLAGFYHNKAVQVAIFDCNLPAQQTATPRTSVAVRCARLQ